MTDTEKRQEDRNDINERELNSQIAVSLEIIKNYRKAIEKGT